MSARLGDGKTSIQMLYDHPKVITENAAWTGLSFAHLGTGVLAVQNPDKENGNSDSPNICFQFFSGRVKGAPCRMP